MRKGIKIITETVGSGTQIQRQQNYRVKLSYWLNHGEPIIWPHDSITDSAYIAYENDGATQVKTIRYNRAQLMDGIFYGLEGMRIGGTRKFSVAPHLAYGERGVPGVVPANALLIVEVTIIE